MSKSGFRNALWKVDKMVGKRVKFTETCLINIMIVMTCFAGIQFFTEDAFAHHSVQELQSIIDDINETLTQFNTTHCIFKGSPGNSSKAVNFTEDRIVAALNYNSFFNETLINFSYFADLMDEVYGELYSLREMLFSMIDDVTDIETQANYILDLEEGIIDYVNEHYEIEEYTEEELIELLLEDTVFINLIHEYVESYYSYIYDQNAQTFDLINFTECYYNDTKKLFSFLEENETNEQEQQMDEKLSKLSLEESKIEINNDTCNSSLSMKNDTKSNTSINGNEMKSESTFKPYLLFTHNKLYGDEGDGENAYYDAEDANVQQIRLDARWDKLDLPDTERWGWDTGDCDFWLKFDQNMKWINSKEPEESMVNILTYEIPYYLKLHANTYYRTLCEDYDIVPIYDWFNFPPRYAALFTSYADKYNLYNDEFGAESSQYFAEQLVMKLDWETGLGNYNIRSFCILNEPNTIINYYNIELPYDVDEYTVIVRYVVSFLGHTFTFMDFAMTIREVLMKSYSTVDMCAEIANTVRSALDEQCIHLNEPKRPIVVNLFSEKKRGWSSDSWFPYTTYLPFNVLGLDVYWSQFWCYHSDDTLSWIRDQIANVLCFPPFNKEWWVIETDGAKDSVTWKNMYIHLPTATQVNEHGVLLHEHYQATVVGFYRLWGPAPSWTGDYGDGYNVWWKENGNLFESPSTDKNNWDYYYEAIGDV